jgi:hypothetical protein
MKNELTNRKMRIALCCLNPNPYCPKSLPIPQGLCPICAHISLIHQQKKGRLVNICFIIQTFYDLIGCFALLFYTDMLEKFKRHIQNPHFQAVLMTQISALYAYPELRNCRLK